MLGLALSHLLVEMEQKEDKQYKGHGTQTKNSFYSFFTRQQAHHTLSQLLSLLFSSTINPKGVHLGPSLPGPHRTSLVASKSGDSSFARVDVTQNRNRSGREEVTRTRHKRISEPGADLRPGPTATKPQSISPGSSVAWHTHTLFRTLPGPSSLGVVTPQCCGLRFQHGVPQFADPPIPVGTQMVYHTKIRPDLLVPGRASQDLNPGWGVLRDGSV